MRGRAGHFRPAVLRALLAGAPLLGALFAAWPGAHLARAQAAPAGQVDAPPAAGPGQPARGEPAARAPAAAPPSGAGANAPLPADLQFLPLRTDIDENSPPPVQLRPGLPPVSAPPPAGQIPPAPAAAPDLPQLAPAVPAAPAGGSPRNVVPPADLQFLPRADVDPRGAGPGAQPGAPAANSPAPAAGAAVPPPDLQFLPRSDVVPASPPAGAAAATSPPRASAGDPAPSAAPDRPAEASEAKPPAKPAAPADPRSDTGPIVKPPVQGGDRWVYRRSTGPTSTVMRQTVLRVSEDGIALRTEAAGSPDSSTALYNRDWALVASGYNDYQPALAYYSFPLYTGKRWSINSAVSNFGAGQTGRVKGEAIAAGWERVTVAAGSFMTLRIEIDMEIADPGDATRTVRVRETHWYARTVLRAVKVESHSVVGDQAPTSEQIELISFHMD